MTDAQEPREKQGADGETNVLSLSSCSQGVLLLLKLAAEDPEFKAELLQQRSGAAADAEVELTSDDEAWLDAMPAPQLEALVLAAAGRSRWAVYAAVAVVILLIVAGFLIWKITQKPQKPQKAQPFVLTPIPATQPHSIPMITAQPAASAAAASAVSASASPAVAQVPSGQPAANLPSGQPAAQVVSGAAGTVPAAAPSATAAATSVAPVSVPVVVAPSPPQPVTALVPPISAAVATPGVPTPAVALTPALFFIPDVLYATVGPVDLVATSDSIFVGQLNGVASWVRAGDAWTGEAVFTCQTPLRGAATAAGQPFRALVYVLGESTDPAAPFAFWRRVNLKAATEWLVFTSGGEIQGLCPLPVADAPLVAQVKQALKIHSNDEAKRWPQLKVELSRARLKNDFLSAFIFEETARSLAPKVEAADALSRAALSQTNAPEPRRAAFWALGWLAKGAAGNEDTRKTQARALTLLVDDAAALVNPESSVRNAYVDALGAAVVSTGTFERPRLPDAATLQSNPAVLIKALRAMAAVYDDQAKKLEGKLAAPSPAPPSSSGKAERLSLTPDQIAALQSDIRLARRRQEICLRMIEALGGEAAPPPAEIPANWGNAPVAPGYVPVWPFGYGFGGHGHDDHHDWPPRSAWPPKSAWPPNPADWPPHSGVAPHH